MQIIRKETLEVAIIDPKKKVGEEGQYVRYQGNHPDIEQVLVRARTDGKEIRRYVEHIVAEDGGIVPVKYVTVEVPPRYVQPFHSHTNVDEIDLISSGELYFIENDSLTEHDIDHIRELGMRLQPGDVVVTSPGKRHTVANLSDTYAFIIGAISSKESVPEFQPDWKR